MKKISILSFLLALSIGIQAQSRIDTSKMASKNKPGINRATRTIVNPPVSTTNPGSAQTQTTTTKITNLPITGQTATGIIYTPPPVLPDLIITNVTFAPNSSNTYTVNYTLKNIGNAPVKKGLLAVQSYINGHEAGGGKAFTMLSEANQLVNPGETVSSSSTFGTNGIIPGNTNNFSINVNGVKINSGTSSEKWVGQQFEELNYANNAFQSNFVIPPPPLAPADILVVITGISKSPIDTSFVRISYTLKNIGAMAIPQTASLSLQSTVEDTDNNPATFLQTACCGQATGGGPVDSGGIPFEPGITKEGFYDARVAGGINFSTLPKNVLYKFNIEITCNGFTDGNGANNKSSFNYRLQ